jgi:hypothetical protein
MLLGHRSHAHQETVAAISVRYLAVYFSPTDGTRGLNIRGKKYEKGRRKRGKF